MLGLMDERLMIMLVGLFYYFCVFDGMYGHEGYGNMAAFFGCLLCLLDADGRPFSYTLYMKALYPIIVLVFSLMLSLCFTCDMIELQW